MPPRRNFQVRQPEHFALQVHTRVVLFDNIYLANVDSVVHGPRQYENSRLNGCRQEEHPSGAAPLGTPLAALPVASRHDSTAVSRIIEGKKISWREEAAA